jgi:transcriptional regulator with XRE-family HTH domain
MKIDMSKSTMSIAEIDEKKRMMQTQLASKKMLTQMLIMKIEEEKSFDEEETLQTIIDEKMKKSLKEKR